MIESVSFLVMETEKSKQKDSNRKKKRLNERRGTGRGVLRKEGYLNSALSSKSLNIEVRET